MQRVIAAAIEREGKILIAQRAYGALKGYWEFPGGKKEEGEDDRQCISREIWEEFSAEIMVGDFIGETVYRSGGKEFVIALYQATLLTEELDLKVHDEICWTTAAQLLDYRLAPADQTLVEAYILEGKR